MPSCSIANCKNFTKSSKENSTITYHRFPKNKSIRKHWIESCFRKDSFNPNNSRICSSHFQQADFYLTKTQKVKLVKSAIPTVNLPHSRSNTTATRGNSKQSKQTAVAGSLTPIVEPASEALNVNNSLSVPIHSLSPNVNISQDNQMALQIERLKDQVRELENSCKIFENKILDLEKKNKDLQDTVNELDKFKQNLISTFKPLLTARQIHSIGYNQKVSRFDNVEIVNALHIKYCSSRAYKILLSFLPLPSQSTLKRWANKIECLPGAQNFIFDLLERKQLDFDISQKLCVIIFDEIEISKKICFLSRKDKILGPYSKCQVVILRGLCSNWKQPIFFAFDFTFNKASFLNLTQKIQNIGLIPIAAVCDYSPTNRALLKELQVTNENPFFSDIKIKHPIFFFADFPHMLKLLRNHVLDQGIILENGYYLSKEIFKNVLDLDNSEVKLCHKISAAHLLVKGSERQNVRKAAQLFSASVANFILQFIPSENIAANFILLINNLFDLFNSSSESNTITHFKMGFSGSADQINLLNVALSEITNLRVASFSKDNIMKKKISLLPFQIGMMQSINALHQLFNYVNINFEIRYILTYKVTQDTLENFFSQIRSIGHSYDHPPPLEFIYRFRILIFMKIFDSIKFCKNVEKEQIQENYITFEIGKFASPTFLKKRKIFLKIL